MAISETSKPLIVFLLSIAESVLCFGLGEWWLIGQGLAPHARPLGTFDLKAMEEVPNEGLITFRGLFHGDRLLVTSPKAIAEVLVQKSYDFEKPEFARTFLQKFLGNGLVVSVGEEHKFQRKHVMPAFSFRHIKELYPMFWTKSLQLCNRTLAEIRDSPVPWIQPIDEKTPQEPEASGNLEINHLANKVTLDIIGLAGLGRDFNSFFGTRNELVDVYEEVTEPSTEKQVLFGLSMIIPPWIVDRLPWELNERVRITTGFLRKKCLELVGEGRELCKLQSEKQIDILSLLIKSNDFSDEQLVDQLLTFLAAGHETTSSAFSWTCYLLAEHRDIQSRLRDELNTAVPATVDNSAPADLSTTLESLNYLNAVCNEVLRFYPTVPSTARVTTVTTSIIGVTIPAGTRVMISPWAINRNTELWGPDAGVFNPSRWLDAATGRFNNEGGVASNYANMTFLHGPRSCIGQNFARAEMRALVAAFVTRFEFVMQRPGKEIKSAGVITAKPKGGVHLRLRKLPGW